MAVIADFMLVYLPAPTVSLRPRMAAVNAGRIAKFFYNCPDNAFQVTNVIMPNFVWVINAWLYIK